MMRLAWFILGACLLGPGLLTAQEFVQVAGVVKQFDAKVGSITVRPSRKGATEDETYSLLNKDIAVTTFSGEKTRLEAVAPGQTVKLTLGPGGDVEAIVVQPNVFLATVQDVDFKQRTVKLTREENLSTTIAVTTNAQILLAGRPAYLCEVKVGSQMNVTASLDGKTAMGLKLVSDPDGKHANSVFSRVKPSRLPGYKWAGVLTDIDAAKSELVLTGPKTKGVPRTMSVAKDAVIKVLYAQVPMQELSLGQIANMTHATVVISPEDAQITHVLADPPTARAKVKTLDADRGRLVVAMDGDEKTFALRYGVKVMNGTRVMRLVDLQPDLSVNLVLSLDRQQLLAVDLRPLAP